MNYYKATRPDGRDFATGTIDYAAALASGEVIRHPDGSWNTTPNARGGVRGWVAPKKVRDEPSTYLSVSVEPADCTGFRWPCRLFRVEPVGRIMANLSASPNKRAVSALRVVEELPAHLALGPNGEQVAAFIERCRGMTEDEARRVVGAWDAARSAAWDAARSAARYAAWDAARSAAWDAARAMVVRDRITPEQYAALVKPFVDAGLGEWVA